MNRTISKMCQNWGELKKESQYFYICRFSIIKRIYSQYISPNLKFNTINLKSITLKGSTILFKLWTSLDKMKNMVLTNAQLIHSFIDHVFFIEPATTMHCQRNIEEIPKQWYWWMMADLKRSTPVQRWRKRPRQTPRPRPRWLSAKSSKTSFLTKWVLLNALGDQPYYCFILKLCLCHVKKIMTDESPLKMKIKSMTNL